MRSSACRRLNLRYKSVTNFTQKQQQKPVSHGGAAVSFQRRASGRCRHSLPDGATASSGSRQIRGVEGCYEIGSENQHDKLKSDVGRMTHMLQQNNQPRTKKTRYNHTKATLTTSNKIQSKPLHLKRPICPGCCVRGHLREGRTGVG